MPALRIALFTLEALPNEDAVYRFVADNAAEVVFVGFSDPHRVQTGGLIGQAVKHLTQSGPLIIPYLLVNFVIPDVVRGLRSSTSWLTGSKRRAMTLRELCRAHRIPTATIDDVNGAQCGAQLALLRPDVIVSFHFDQIFDEDMLSIAPHGILNVHPSLLPLHRGPVPTIHAIDADSPTFGVSVHKVVRRIDAGNLLAQALVSLPPGCTATTAAYVLHQHGRVLLEAVLDDVRSSGLAEGVSIVPTPYRPFPPASHLWDMHRRKRKLTNWRDVWHALGLRRPALGTSTVVLDPARLPIAPSSSRGAP